MNFKGQQIILVLVAGVLGSIALGRVSVLAQTVSADPKVEKSNQLEGTAEAAQPLSPLSEKIKAHLEGALSDAGNASDKGRFGEMALQYEQENFSAIWLSGGIPNDKARVAVNALNLAGEHGLNPDDYNAEALFQKLGARSEDTLADLEVELTRSVIAYAQHLNAGRMNPKSVNREIVVFPKAVSVETLMTKLRATSNLAVLLRLMAPHTPRYERLRLALLDYRKRALTQTWTKISEGEVLKPDMENERVVELRKRLIEDGSLSAALADGVHFDEPVVAALKDFQIRHGLEADGVVGPRTLKALNVSLQERVSMMAINLERRRWMQNNYGRYYVFANLADQTIKLVRDEKTLHHELIQVGKPYHRTPVFTDTIEYLEINPYWNVPYSIATKEYLPKLKSNPGILVAQNIKVLAGGKIISPYSVPWNSYSRGHFPVRLRQDSGKKNALGRIKFMFPNKFNVYIHDTPSKSKFNKASRYFSHGCLRLRNPLDMAEQILGPEGWSRQKIDGVVQRGKRTVVKLKEQIPVHVTYLTSWVNKDGSVHFREDVYGRDKILAKAMGI